MVPMLRPLSLIGLLMAALAVPGAARDAEPDEATAVPADDAAVARDDIVVTGRKIEERLQDIPIAITAVEGAALEMRTLDTLDDLEDLAPNLEITATGQVGGAPSETVVHMRGIGQIDSAIFADPGVGIYLDGVYLARAQGALLDLLDLERIEVLRGPQGTLFGKNTTGGAVQLVTRTPGPTRRGEVALTLGNRDRRNATVRLEGALDDDARLTARLALSSRNQDGYARSRVTDQIFGEDNTDVGRLSVRAIASPRTIVDVGLSGTRTRGPNLDQSLIAIFDGTPLLDFYNRALRDIGLPQVDDAFVPSDPFVSFAGDRGRSDGDVWTTSVTVTHQLTDAIDLVSITAYRDLAYAFDNDPDGTPLRFAFSQVDQDQDQLSQELRLSSTAGARTTWIAGVYALREEAREDGRLILFEELFGALEAAPGPIYAPPGAPGFLCDPGPPPPGVPCFGGPGNPLNASFLGSDDELLTFTTESYAAFGEAVIRVTPRVSLSAGLRYSYETKSLRYRRDAAFDPRDVDLRDDESWDALSPRLIVSITPDSSTLLYASATRGFRSGGFNARPQDRQSLDPFDPERVTAYELGAKLDRFDGRLRLNAAAFYNDYTDLQLSASLLVDGQPLFVLQNAGEAETWGVELETTWRATERLVVGLTAGYLQTDYTELRSVAPDGADLDGELPKAPAWSGAVSLASRHPLAGDAALSLQIDAGYRDDYFNDIANTPVIATDASEQIDARLSYDDGRRWRLDLFGTNLSDEVRFENGFVTGGFGIATAVYSAPRTWGGTVSYRF
ncbi:MAG: TonB-dependent receptor [Acidobacteriota bacterium]